MIEEWRPIGEMHYEISCLGNVKNTKTRRPVKGRISKYTTVILTHKGEQTTHYIHRLVSIAFIPNPDNKKQVNHINGIKTDNRVENLEWCTPKENISHAFTSGLLVRRGIKNSQHKLKEHDVLLIRAYRSLGISVIELSNIFDCAENTIRGAITKKYWSHV